MIMFEDIDTEDVLYVIAFIECVLKSYTQGNNKSFNLKHN